MRLGVQLIVIIKQATSEAAYNDERGHWANKGGHLWFKALKARYVDTLNVIMCVNDMAI